MYILIAHRVLDVLWIALQQTRICIHSPKILLIVSKYDMIAFFICTRMKIMCMYSTVYCTLYSDMKIVPVCLCFSMEAVITWMSSCLP